MTCTQLLNKNNLKRFDVLRLTIRAGACVIMKPSPQFDKNSKFKINLKHANSMTRVAGKTPVALGSPKSLGKRLRASIDAEDELAATPKITAEEFDYPKDIETW